MDAAVALDGVREEIRRVLLGSGLEAEYRTGLEAVLHTPDHIFGYGVEPKWPLVVLLCYSSASGGRWEEAVPAAAAMELYMAALNILDDVEDGDRLNGQTETEKAVTLNRSTGLLFLAQQTLWRTVPRGVDIQTVGEMAESIAGLLVRACGGQHLDLIGENLPQVSLNQAWGMTAMKAGSIGRCVAYAGARLGTSDSSLVDRYGEFGWHYGILAQLSNDCHDLTATSTLKSDLRRRKKTLPIAYLLTDPSPLGRQAREIMARNRSPTPEEEKTLRESLASSGAFHYAATVADTHRRKAREALLAIGDARPMPPMLLKMVGQEA
ncbi:MAG: polyprenyl synthetase family protein [Chloroflexi bacterium]|nr:polyprenyl synthetase family protein [Chloroflexota bacterium]